MRSSKVSGPVYAFVPAHGGSKAGAVQDSLGRTWSECFGLAVLLVDLAPGDDSNAIPVIYRDGLVDRYSISSGTDGRAIRTVAALAETSYNVVCVDLTGANEPTATAILNVAHSIFVVTDSAAESVEIARKSVARLKRMNLEDRTALLLRRTEGGLRPDIAEDRAGAPVCGLLETPDQINRLARWLAQPQAAVDYQEAVEAVSA